jgi:ketosteroid isomerase-like protein
MRVVNGGTARIVLVLASVWSACSPSPKAAPMDAGGVDSAGVGLAREELANSVLAHDGPRLAKVYAESAVVAAPGAPTLYGRAAIESFIVPAFATTSYASYQIRPLAVTGRGGVLGEIGWQHEVGAQSGSAAEETWGRYAITWVRDASGNWKVAMDALVADSSVPVAAKVTGKP